MVKDGKVRGWKGRLCCLQNLFPRGRVRRVFKGREAVCLLEGKKSLFGGGRTVCAGFGEEVCNREGALETVAGGLKEWASSGSEEAGMSL